MDDKHRELGTQLTVDLLLARLDDLERAFAALQRAYVDLQATARARGRAPLVDDVLVSAGASGDRDGGARVSGVDPHLHA